MMQQQEQIFYKIGGINALHDIVDDFYERVMADPVVNFFFERVDMEMQRAKMKAFLMMALGGPALFTGNELRVAHGHLVSRMGLNDSHFDAVVAHLDAALARFDVAAEVRRQVVAVTETVRGAVLNKDTGGEG